MCLILKGSVEVMSVDESMALASLEHGHFFGEMAMLLGIPRTATIRTKQPCELFVIHDRDLKVFLAQWPDVEERISQVLKAREAELRGLGQMPELPENRSLVQQFRERVRLWFAATWRLERGRSPRRSRHYQIHSTPTRAVPTPSVSISSDT